MRITMTVLACAALAACSPSIPESGAGAGVGFSDYDEYLAQKRAREAALTGSALPPVASVSSEPLGATPGASDADNLAADTRATLAQTSGTATGVPATQPTAGTATPQTVSTAGGISSENDFDAVGAERTIQDDAALIAQNRAQYKVIEATSLPQRSGGEGPNIVQYAISTTHPVGTPVYRRVGFNKEGRMQRNCAKFPSAEAAQMEFLAKGGPTRDRSGLDPDGDGYACGWDPAPFRKAVASGGAGGA
ncbi:MAG: excalibur calcium-binding domain-containing protein [Roseovarius sp.]